MRSHLAYLAARLMAEGGIHDYAQAKQKAARQAGVPDTHSLPDNREIEEALRAYQALYHQEEHGAALTLLRQQAARLMEMVEAFNPYLVGSVLTGTAGRYSDINLHLYCDSAKDVEIFLLNKRIEYESGTRRVRLGDRQLDLPTLTLDFEGTTATLTVFHTDDLRIVPKYRADGRSIERARLAQVKELLAPEPSNDSEASSSPVGLAAKAQP
jgi:predicted nucleotidyltransferase